MRVRVLAPRGRSSTCITVLFFFRGVLKRSRRVDNHIQPGVSFSKGGSAKVFEDFVDLEEVQRCLI